MGISLSRRVGRCAHDHYLPGIVAADPPSGLDRRDGIINIPRTIKEAHRWPGIGRSAMEKEFLRLFALCSP